MVAPLISIEKIVKHYGTLKVLDDVSLTIDEGEFIALLGPSGCGKTTLLRTIAGFAEVTSGRILLGGQDITRLPPNRRPVNTVFQNYALFPHMTVADNVAYGPRRTGSRGAELRRIVDEAIATVGMDQMAGRYPSQLSGGQQQRVALARAIANRPRVLLLDEPLGALDLKLRKQMQIELKTLQRKLGMTFIFVTHDQEEALVLADRIAVMDAGRIAQLGTGEEIYHAPSEEYVADFIGDANLIRCVVDKDGVARSTEGDLVLGKAARPPGAGVALLRRIVDEAIATVGMDQMAGRYPSQLSGGQQQRVALARAIANRPRVLLLDEPLGALDLKLRKQMQIELKTLQRKLGMTFIFVTHDQEEALVLADRIAVMDAGRIAQLGTGEEIYHAPSEEYVADFIGDANLIRCVVDKDGVARSTEGDLVLGKAARPPGAGVALLRPEAVAIAAAGQEPQSFQRTVEAVVTSIIFVGHAVRVGAQIVNGPQVVAQHPSGPGRVPFVVGQQVRLGWDDSAVTVLRS